MSPLIPLLFQLFLLGLSLSSQSIILGVAMLEQRVVEQSEIETLNLLKTQLEKVRVKVAKQVGENGGLFGAVTKDDIANALKEQKGFEVDKKILEFGTIKTTGIYDVSAKFIHGINAKFEIEVVGL